MAKIINISNNMSVCMRELKWVLLKIKNKEDLTNFYSIFRVFLQKNAFEN